MPNTVVFLWVSAVVLEGGPRAAAPSIEPTPRSLAALRDFGAVRGLTFGPVAETQARPMGSPREGITSGAEPALVDLLEAELEQARTALSALEEAGASALLRKVQTELLAHPYLPQAPFLMAECLALQAQAARGVSPELAADLDAQRFALEGPRAVAFGEPPAPPSPQAITVSVRGLDASDRLELDAERNNPERTRLVPGLHHVRVWRRGRLAFASFVNVAPAQSELTLDVPELRPCSRDDLERVSDDAAATPLPPGIACERWARVRSEGTGIGVSLCEHSRCGAFLHWEQRAPAPFAPIATARRHFPAWAGLVIAGGATLAAGSLVLWQSGAFDRDRASAAGWRFGGLNP